MRATFFTTFLALAAGTACQDYKFSPRPEDPTPGDDTAAQDCTPEEGEAQDTAVSNCVEARAGGVQVGPEWDVATFEFQPDFSQILGAPTVGDLTGDGVPEIVVVTDDDDQDNFNGLLRVLSGEDGGEVLNFQSVRVDVDAKTHYLVSPYRYSNTALGDVDSDGFPEIAVVMRVELNAEDQGGGGDDTDTGAPDDPGPGDTDDWSPVIKEPDSYLEECTLGVIELDGSLKWADLNDVFVCGGHAPAIADLDADGAPEIIVGDRIVNGADGTLRGKGDGGVGAYPAYAEIGWFPVPADLDMDGIQEVVAGSSVYDPDGNTICSVPTDAGDLPFEADPDGFPGVADLDGDGLGEFVVIGFGQARVYEHDCTLITGWELGVGGNGGPPTIGDFDADGLPEIGVAGSDAYRVFDPDGTLLWSNNGVIDVSSHAGSASLFDLDGDGRMEVISTDEVALWILDAATGEVLLQDDRHTSRSLHEYPVVADVDADGAVEIVVPNGGGHYDWEYTGIFILESALDPWEGGRAVWNQHAYSITNIDDDLTVPREPAPNWPDHNNFRSGDPGSPRDLSAADAWPAVGETCVSCSDEVIFVSFRVFNSGQLTLAAGLPYAIYSVDDFDDSWEQIDAGELENDLAPGTSTLPIILEIDPADLRDGRLVISVDDVGGESGDGTVTECSEENNVLELDGLLCE